MVGRPIGALTDGSTGDPCKRCATRASICFCTSRAYSRPHPRRARARCVGRGHPVPPCRQGAEPSEQIRRKRASASARFFEILASRCRGNRGARHPDRARISVWPVSCLKSRTSARLLLPKISHSPSTRAARTAWSSLGTKLRKMTIFRSSLGQSGLQQRSIFDNRIVLTIAAVGLQRLEWRNSNDQQRPIVPRHWSG